MKYICDVTGKPIPEGQNVELDTKPKLDSELRSDFKKSREYLSRRFMIAEGVVKQLIEWIDNGDFVKILEQFPGTVLDNDQHRNHKYKVQDCDQCSYEEFHELEHIWRGKK